MRKLIAGMEIVSGILILVVFLLQFGIKLGIEVSQGLGTIFIPWSLNLILGALIPLTFGLVNIVAGISLWRDKKFGYLLSIIIQFTQLVSIQTPNFYAFCYSLLGCIYAFSHIGVNSLYGLGFAYLISFDPQPVTTTFVGINIIALILIISIYFLYRKKIRSFS